MGASENNGSRAGFTLIELSIVLVIIGLIVGGVLTGRNLIRASELRSIVTDEQRYVTAVNTFRTKYNELPGDMVDATNYWGTQPFGCPSVSYLSNITSKTCNGNGNGIIDGNGSSPSTTVFEADLAWQHLSNAGLIAGSFAGTPGPLSASDQDPGVNVPATKFSTGGFQWNYFYSTSAPMWLGSYFLNLQVSQQYLFVGSRTGTDLTGFLLAPSDAFYIDQKMDDGLPGSGRVTSNNTTLDGWQFPCSTSDTPSTALYNMSLASPGCILVFWVGF